jgi:hypothetical protein
MISIRDSFAILFLIIIVTTIVVQNQRKYSMLVFFGLFLGFFRKILPNESNFIHFGLNFDPLLLVIPISLIALWVSTPKSSKALTSLERSILLLIVLASLQILNPRQGNFLVGLTGWIAYAVPLMFIYLGRDLDNKEIKIILNSIKIFGVVICFYGFLQVTLGYFYWDKRWFESVTSSGEYTALNFGKNRPFGTLSSVGEYSQVIGIGAGVIAFQFLTKEISKLQFTVLSLVFLGSSMLTASRSALILTLITILLPFLIRIDYKSKIAKTYRYILLVIFSIFMSPLIVNQIPKNILGNSATLLERQIAGLSGNANGVTSAYVHILQTIQAFFKSFTSIFGYGVGSISGAQKINGQVRMNFETDIGNSGYAFGILGLLIMIIIFIQIYLAISKVDFTRAACSILLLLPSLNNWFNPGHYSTVWVLWLLMGALLQDKESASGEQ